MRRVPVNVGDRSYEIRIGEGLVRETAGLLGDFGPWSRRMVVSDDHVAPLAGEPVTSALQRAGWSASLAVVPAGETSKSLAMLERLYHEFAVAKLDRASVIVAVGGGVVGDLAGFAAATYMRGLDVVQVPTTLLAQVDAAIGGKTGIDLPEGKNLVGAIHQPRLVLIDLAMLGTLPEHEYRSGMAEVIKYGVIADPGLLDLLETNHEAITGREMGLLEEVVARCCAIKAAVVAEDEQEGGRRAILNFGHTVGHALETVTGYSEYSHGEAIAIGMVAALRLSERLAGLPERNSNRVRELLLAYGLPLAPRRPVEPEELLGAMRRDKKARGGTLRFVLARGPGEVELFPVEEGVVRELWEGTHA